jgi:hypothetical protein
VLVDGFKIADQPSGGYTSNILEAHFYTAIRDTVAMRSRAAVPNLETEAATQYGRSMTTEDVYPGPLRRFLAAVAKDPDVVGKWWPDGPGGPGGPSKGKYADLWGKLSQDQRDVLQSGSLDAIAQAVDERG